MEGGMVAGMAALALDTGKRSSGPGSNRSMDDKSAEPGKVSGTRGSFNVKGGGSVLEVQGGSITSGYLSGSVNAGKAAAFRQDHRPLDECSGTDQSFNVESGGKIVIAGGICSGALSSDGVPREFFPQYLANLQPVVPPSHHSTR